MGATLRIVGLGAVQERGRDHDHPGNPLGPM